MTRRPRLAALPTSLTLAIFLPTVMMLGTMSQTLNGPRKRPGGPTVAPDGRSPGAMTFASSLVTSGFWIPAESRDPEYGSPLLLSPSEGAVAAC